MVKIDLGQVNTTEQMSINVMFNVLFLDNGPSTSDHAHIRALVMLNSLELIEEMKFDYQPIVNSVSVSV